MALRGAAFLVAAVAVGAVAAVVEVVFFGGMVVQRQLHQL